METNLNTIEPIVVTAFHEAAHAVVAIYHKIRFQQVSIISNANSSGRVSFKQSFTDKEIHAIKSDIFTKRVESKLRKHMAVDLAGFLTERRLGIADSAEELPFNSDWNNLVDWSIRLKGCDVDQANLLIDQITEETEALIGKEEIWNKIESVAKALQENKELTYEKVLELYNRPN